MKCAETQLEITVLVIWLFIYESKRHLADDDFEQKNEWGFRSVCISRFKRYSFCRSSECEEVVSSLAASWRLSTETAWSFDFGSTNRTKRWHSMSTFHIFTFSIGWSLKCENYKWQNGCQWLREWAATGRTQMKIQSKQKYPRTAQF